MNDAGYIGFDPLTLKQICPGDGSQTTIRNLSACRYGALVLVDRAGDICFYFSETGASWGRIASLGRDGQYASILVSCLLVASRHSMARNIPKYGSGW